MLTLSFGRRSSVDVRESAISHLMLLARLTILSSPTTDMLLLETMDKLLEETYTDMLGCSMSRSSIGLASAVAPSAVKQGGGVTNQLSSMQPLSWPDLLLRPLPPHSLPEPGDTDGVEEGVDSLARLGRVTGVVAPTSDRLTLGQDRGSDATAPRARPLCVRQRLRGVRGPGARHSVLVCAFG